MGKARPIIEMKGIVKKFGGLTALDYVDLKLWRGECLGLVGENGAGKSTLIKVLSGIYQPDEGRILVDGNEVTIHNRGEARALGIDAVYQDLALVDTLDASANVFLGNEISTPILGRFFHILDNRKMYRESQKLLTERLGIDLGGRKDPVFNLSGGERQSVAIARAIYWTAKVLIMDEPTASIGIREATKLFSIVHKAKEAGVSVIWISHNLDQVFAVADSLLVLRGGKCVGVGRCAETTKAEIVGLIVGEVVEAA